MKIYFLVLLSGFTFWFYFKKSMMIIQFISLWKFPVVYGSNLLLMSINLHVKLLFYKDSPIPLREWFRQDQSNNCKLTDVGQLESFPAYIVNRV